MTNRELDAAVAEHVMGYDGEPFYFCTADGESMNAWVSKDGPWYTLGELQEWLKEKQERGFCLDHRIEEERRFPEYTSDAAPDYEVLKRVRETWDEPMQDKWHVELQNVWIDRRGGPMLIAFTAIDYQPGDFSRAALAALGVT